MLKHYREQSIIIAPVIVTTFVVVTAIFGPTIARAEGSLIDAVVLLNTNNHAKVEAGIQQIGMLGDPAGVKHLEQRIQRGLPPDLLELSITTLMAISHPSSGPILFRLATHRRPKIRALAVEAIAATNPPGAEGVLVAALSDDSAEVRAKAAIGLGEIHAINALDTLFRALDRGVLEASEAIGKVIPASNVPHLFDYIDKLPLYSLGPALMEVLARNDVPIKTQLAVVQRLQEIATPEVKNYLIDFIGKYGETAPKPLVREVRNTILKIAD
jgi:HEAT repeat protein